MGYEFFAKGANSTDLSEVMNKAAEECVNNGLIVIGYSTDDGPNNKDIVIKQEINEKIKILLKKNRQGEEIAEKIWRNDRI